MGLKRTPAEVAKANLRWLKAFKKRQAAELKREGKR